VGALAQKADVSKSTVSVMLKASNAQENAYALDAKISYRKNKKILNLMKITKSNIMQI
jgi:hypothetical protein